MIITSDELNYLVYRYLLEAGFTHSAYTFGHESFQNKNTNIDGRQVQPGALISYMQKGLLYTEAETHYDYDKGKNVVCNEPFSLIKKHHCKSSSLKDSKRRDNENSMPTSNFKASKKLKKEVDEIMKDGDRQGDEKKDQSKTSSSSNKQEELKKNKATMNGGAEPQEEEIVVDNMAAEKNKNNNNEQQDKMDVSEPKLAVASKSTTETPVPSSGGKLENETRNATILFSGKDVSIIQSHTSIPTPLCEWSNNESSSTSQYTLATGSNAGVVDLWNINTKQNITIKDSSTTNVNVTSLCWHSDDQSIGVGYNNGAAVVYGIDGSVKQRFKSHKGSVSALGFNRKGDVILSSSTDGTAVVWNAIDGQELMKLSHHTGAILKADWRNNLYFATCGVDTMINMCKVGDASFVRKFQGHTKQVNCIKWDPTGNMMASCSDDKSVKIWNLRMDTYACSFGDHKDKVLDIKWSPSKTCVNVASASEDCTAKLWDINKETCLFSYQGHTKAVKKLAFNNTGSLLGTVSADKFLHLWSTRTGKVVQSYKHDSELLNCSWNLKGQIALTAANGAVSIIDTRNINM